MDFEEWYLENSADAAMDVLKDAFEAGQQNKQAEIDGLEKKLKYEKLAYKNIKLQFLNKQHDLDELQAEIDALKNKIQTALNKACMLQNSSGERIYAELKEILK